MPLEYTRGIVRWGHPDGYFMNAEGKKLAHTFSPTNQKGHQDGSCYPCDCVTKRASHILMALAFYGDRPIDRTTGKPCVCHHLIPDKLDYKPANLLCWLTRAEHAEADRRQRALRKIVPNGDLHVFTYDRLRQLQDPRVTSVEEFETQRALIEACHLQKMTPLETQYAAAEERTKYADEFVNP